MKARASQRHLNKTDPTHVSVNLTQPGAGNIGSKPLKETLGKKNTTNRKTAVVGAAGGPNNLNQMSGS